MFSFFRGLLAADEPPTKVIEVRSDNYISRTILYRENSIILYGPTLNPKNTLKEKPFEIVLHRPITETLTQAFSLFRSDLREEAENRFISYKDKIPLYALLTKECTAASLQRVCDILGQNGAWSIAHLAAHFALPDLFNDPRVQQHLNEQEPLVGATPIMIAIRTGNTRLVQSIISLKCSLDIVDYNGDSVFHYAASTTKEIIAALVAATINKRLLDAYNKTGQTALHVACRADRLDCVRALLVAGANVNLPAAPSVARSAGSTHPPGNVGDFMQDPRKKVSQEDMKRGGTPLHWAMSREVIEALVDKQCDINAGNFDQRSALHVMAMRGRLECLVALLAHGAEVNLRDNDGNTALHLAVSQSSVAIVQALIVFGADIDMLNHVGHSARHLVPIQHSSAPSDHILYCLHAVGAKRCNSDMEGCGAGCRNSEGYVGVPPPNAPGTPESIASQKSSLQQLLDDLATKCSGEGNGRLLCLDGGGIRGLVLVQILLALEEIMDKPIIHCFDFVAGTSTGGIIALALAVGRTLVEIQRLYVRLKDVAFVGARPYSSEPLENILKEYLGTETVMTDITHPKIMVLGVIADRKPIELHIFRNYESPEKLLDRHMGIRSDPTPPQKVWEAARATGAAPSYFRAYGKFLDGGLIGNNPTMDALTELRDMRAVLTTMGKQREADLFTVKVVVSCGTGIPPTTKLKDVDVFRPESLMDTARLAWGLSALGALLVDQATQADGRVVERARSWCGYTNTAYHRYSPRLSHNVSMDERSDQLLVHMLWETKAYMRANLTKLHGLKLLLEK